MQDWHTDGPPTGSEAGETAPYAICIFVPLQDLAANPTMGCTQFWPGTHNFRHLLGFGPAAVALHSTADALVGAGDAVVYDYRTLHRGLPNESSRRREVLQFVYHVATYREARNFAGHSMYAD
jgi:ectoine hydroxylase-related dioxygenase (phytanoyl-CoA dioxygenase family)